MAQPSFEDRVLECIDRGLSSLGKSTRQSIYWHIEHQYGLKREYIPGRPKEFIKALKTLFGPGASPLERMIVREMNSAFKVVKKAESFEEAVAQARKVDG